MARRTEFSESGSSPEESQSERGGRARAPGRQRGARGLVAIGFMQLVALVGIVALAVALGAVLVDSANVTGWIDGLVIGAGSVVLTILVLFSGRHARRH
jgi:hypothetical protein